MAFEKVAHSWTGRDGKRHYEEAEKARAFVKTNAEEIIRHLAAMAWAAANGNAEEAYRLRVVSGKKCDEMKSVIAETCKARQ